MSFDFLKNPFFSSIPHDLKVCYQALILLVGVPAVVMVVRGFTSDDPALLTLSFTVWGIAIPIFSIRCIFRIKKFF